MAIIIGDIHGDLAMARTFLAYKPQAEHIALGDIVDSRDPLTPFDEELACLDLLLDSDAILVWGNHDLAYLSPAPWEIAPRFPDFASVLRERFQAAASSGRFTAAHAAGDWLCTHAGVSTALAAALPSAPWGSGNPSAIASWICEEFEREFATKGRPWHKSFTPYGKGPLFYRDWTRGGEDPFGGIFWYDPQWEPSHPPDPRFKQIFGHTKVAGPMRKLNHVNIHIEDGWWVFDTDGEEFVRLGP